VRDVLFGWQIQCKYYLWEFEEETWVEKPKLNPFVVKMADQRKVQPIGLIRNLKINLARCEYKFLL
jgi:hypothetical protein